MMLSFVFSTEEDLFQTPRMHPRCILQEEPYVAPPGSMSLATWMAEDEEDEDR
jgi:hypothetical protein